MSAAWVKRVSFTAARDAATVRFGRHWRSLDGSRPLAGRPRRGVRDCARWKPRCTYPEMESGNLWASPRS
jgi:hypothetical protein